MVPIVFALVPTIIGSGMLVGLNDSGNKGALLFGEAPATTVLHQRLIAPNSCLLDWHIR